MLYCAYQRIRLEFGILYLDEERVIVCVLPADQSRTDLSSQEMEFILPLLGEEAQGILDNIWDCDFDANVVSRLHVDGSQPGDRPNRYLRWLRANGFFDSEDTDDDDDDDDDDE